MFKLGLYICLLLLSSCSKPIDSNGKIATPETLDQGWLIPFSAIVDASGGKETIRSINNPSFLKISNPANDYLKDNDLIIGSITGGSAKAYPHKILNFHEIVNDSGITINYCPLTGTTFGWNNSESDFGVSGLLYKNNLILYDHKTDSNWSQLLLKCVNGTLIKTEPKVEPIIETTWKTWKSLYPNTLVLKGTTEQTFNNNANGSTLSGKERVYTIINKDEESKIYSFDTFTNGEAIKDNFNNKTYLIVGNKDLIVAFELNEEFKDVEFTYSHNNSTHLFSDNNGNQWNAFGEAIIGPEKGSKLLPTTSVIGFTIAIDDFYPNALKYVD